MQTINTKALLICIKCKLSKISLFKCMYSCACLNYTDTSDTTIIPWKVVKCHIGYLQIMTLQCNTLTHSVKCCLSCSAHDISMKAAYYYRGPSNFAFAVLKGLIPWSAHHIALSCQIRRGKSHNWRYPAGYDINEGVWETKCLVQASLLFISQWCL